MVTPLLPLLQLHDLGCRRGGRDLFKGLNFGLDRGSLLRVSGANGAGKTSLLRMVCGLLLPTTGEVLWRGRRIGAQREEFHRQLAYLGHGAAVKDDLSAIENLQSSARLAGVDADRTRAAAALASTGLRGHERLTVRSLSQGQRRRVALARLVLASDAPLWVLDEPFNALDAAASAWLAQLIGAHAQRGGIVLWSGHQTELKLNAAVPQEDLLL